MQADEMFDVLSLSPGKNKEGKKKNLDCLKFSSVFFLFYFFIVTDIQKVQ